MELSLEEFQKINTIARLYYERGISENPPKFVVFMGNVGSGKTTIRKDKFANNYVHLDFGEIVNSIKKEFGENNPRLSGYASLVGDLILENSLESKKNIVIEIIGENEEIIDPVIRKMTDIGYETSVTFISCDLSEGYNRHLKAVKEDPEYISSYFTQEATLSFFYRRLELGDMPAILQD